MKQWSQEICAEYPKELELVAPGIYIQRRNIVEVTHEAMDDMPEYTDYSCESREITVSEYETLKSIEEINTSQAIDAYTLQLMEEGVI
jgi:hypothetical protein